MKRRHDHNQISTTQDLRLYHHQSTCVIDINNEHNRSTTKPNTNTSAHSTLYPPAHSNTTNRPISLIIKSLTPRFYYSHLSQPHFPGFPHHCLPPPLSLFHQSLTNTTPCPLLLTLTINTSPNTTQPCQNNFRAKLHLNGGDQLLSSNGSN